MPSVCCSKYPHLAAEHFSIKCFSGPKDAACSNNCITEHQRVENCHGGVDVERSGVE